MAIIEWCTLSKWSIRLLSLSPFLSFRNKFILARHSLTIILNWLPLATTCRLLASWLLSFGPAGWVGWCLSACNVSHRINRVSYLRCVPSLEYYSFDLLALAYQMRISFEPNWGYRYRNHHRPMIITIIIMHATTTMCMLWRTSSPFLTWRHKEEIIYNSDIYLIQTRRTQSAFASQTIAGVCIGCWYRQFFFRFSSGHHTPSVVR